ncbi:sulfatase-like hydrolase/transferase [Halosquirtibacter xylanolyticus]|uniref:sulfatase-like hydrolase/transferase n=1 Tax=Halosquirtibacter xylanolyticus TaxID=3374599 RepID=UPI0037489860|nr:sulfatase-like hydrolase/transferase [Prolixibacteraceae bacterium]
MNCLKKITVTAFSTLFAFSSFAKKTEKPNIIFILLDDMGKEWVQNYGANDVKTPNIDKLAKNGIKFTNTYSMPQCTPSRVTLLTGQYPFNHGWVNHYDVPRWGHGVHFDADVNPSFAKMLQKEGYKTCVAGKWQLNDFRLEPKAMVDVGFQEYCMWTGGEGGGDIETSVQRYWNPYIHTKKGSKTYKGQFGEDVFSDFIIDFMSKNKKDPMMVYYPMCLPHGPLTTTPNEPNAPKGEQHKAMVRYADHILGKIVHAVDSLGLSDNTMIFWTTDNGTSGNIIGHLKGRPVRGGKTKLSENGINAPLIVSAPGRIKPNQVSEELVDFTDILPTFCDLAGASKNKKYKYDGYSFVPLLNGNTNETKRSWIVALGSNGGHFENGRLVNSHSYRDRSIRNKRYKAYVDTLGQVYELIDLKNDFYEHHNLIRSNKKEIQEAIENFQAVVNQFPKKDHVPNYRKLKKSYYDIPDKDMNKNCLKGKAKPNKSKLPF